MTDQKTKIEFNEWFAAMSRALKVVMNTPEEETGWKAFKDEIRSRIQDGFWAGRADTLELLKKAELPSA